MTNLQAIVYGIVQVLTEGATIIATIAAFVAGYASISFLLRWIARHSMDAFAVYRIGLGLITLGLAATSAIS